jgi:hypothetical protein
MDLRFDKNVPLLTTHIRGLREAPGIYDIDNKALNEIILGAPDFLAYMALQGVLGIFTGYLVQPFYVYKYRNLDFATAIDIMRQRRSKVMSGADIKEAHLSLLMSWLRLKLEDYAVIPAGTSLREAAKVLWHIWLGTPDVRSTDLMESAYTDILQNRENNHDINKHIYELL